MAIPELELHHLRAHGEREHVDHEEQGDPQERHGVLRVAIPGEITGQIPPKEREDDE